MKNSIYGYEELLQAAALQLPPEFEIISAMENDVAGIKSDFDIIPTLNDLIKQRQAQRILGQTVEPFRNAALNLYESGKINESQLWDIVEKVTAALP